MWQLLLRRTATGLLVASTVFPVAISVLLGGASILLGEATVLTRADTGMQVFFKIRAVLKFKLNGLHENVLNFDSKCSGSREIAKT